MSSPSDHNSPLVFGTMKPLSSSPPQTPPTTADLLVDMEFLLDARTQPVPDRYYDIYHQHWELYQRSLITRDDFDKGVDDIYSMINTEELQDLHERINSEAPTGIEELSEPWGMADYLRLMDAITAVFRYAGDEAMGKCLLATEIVIGRMKKQREEMGL